MFNFGTNGKYYVVCIKIEILCVVQYALRTLYQLFGSANIGSSPIYKLFNWIQLVSQHENYKKWVNWMSVMKISVEIINCNFKLGWDKLIWRVKRGGGKDELSYDLNLLLLFLHYFNEHSIEWLKRLKDDFIRFQDCRNKSADNFSVL